MHTVKTIKAPAYTTGSAAPWMALFALSTVPLFALQLSFAATLQMVAFLSLAIVALAHFTDEKNFEVTHLAIKVIAPLQFALMIWLSVQMGQWIAGASFAASYAISIACLSGIVVVEGISSAALALIAGSCRAVTGLSLVTLISAKYAGLLGGVK
jgi:hypothetical protein